MGGLDAAIPHLKAPCLHCLKENIMSKQTHELLARCSLSDVVYYLKGVLLQLKKHYGLSQTRVRQTVPYSTSSINLSKLTNHQDYYGQCQLHSLAFLKAIIAHFRIQVHENKEGRLEFHIPPVQAAHHYVYYFWTRKERLGKALFEVAEDGSKAQLGFVDQSGQELFSYEEGSVRIGPRNLFIHFKLQGAESFIVLHKPQVQSFNQPYLMGTYTAARISDFTPVAGMVLLEHQPDHKAAIHRLQDSSDDALLEQALHWARLESPTEKLFSIPKQAFPSLHARNWEKMRREIAQSVAQELREGLG